MKKVVVIGAGFAGVRTALDLSRNSEIELTVINNTDFHTYIPNIHEIIGNASKSDDDFKKYLNVPLNKIFQNKKINLIIDTANGIDFENKQIKTIKSGTLDFDYLIIATGSTTSYFGILGADKYSHTFKKLDDALKVRADISQMIQSKDQPVSIVIAGGGFTGVELAGSLSEFVKTSKSKITIVEGSEILLPGIEEWVQKSALSKLKEIGVEIKTSSLISEVKESQIILKDSATLNFDYLIWTTGVKGSEINYQAKGIVLNKKDQLSVSANLNISTYPNIFVIGDKSEVPDPKTGKFIPQTAWAAIAEGEIAAKNIISSIKGKSLMEYIPQKAVFVVPIGEGYAISNIFGSRVSGFLGWFLKRLIHLKYLLSILNITQALSIWFKS